MLIPLGILATAGAGGAGGSAYELISSPFISGGTTSFTFSSIPQTYRHLQIRAITQPNAGAAPIMTFNGVTTATYAHHSLWAISTQTTVRSEGSSSQNRIVLSENTSTVANSFAPYVIDILDYTSSSKNKTVRSVWGNAEVNSDYKVGMHSGLWASTDPITSITISQNVTTFKDFVRWSLYGIKG